MRVVSPMILCAGARARYRALRGGGGTRGGSLDGRPPRSRIRPVRDGEPEPVGGILLRILTDLADNAADEHTALELRRTVADLRGAATEAAA